ncbi:MAG TPA: winged helix-turn-helix domain-containing protein, partial [Alphaproteobacteria bacterium]|nr:winged helix-turn-helix domain-containing protein [Alphaproteobacteria bacterium]
TLISWIKRMDESLDQLNVQPGRGRKSLLSIEEETTVKGWLSQDSQLTIDRLKVKIEEELEKCLGRSTIHRLMKKLSFSSITPWPRHYKQDAKILEEAKKNLEETL